MPKETFEDEAGMYDIQVSWSREFGYVQLGVETHSKLSIADMLTSATETPADFTGLWGTMNKEKITALIKALQKAKRQAF